MKNMIIAACLLLAPLMSFSQQSNPAIQSFYDKYSEIDNVSDIELSGGLLKFISSYASDESGIKDPIEKVSYLRILVMNDGNIVKPADLSNLLRSVKADAFEDLMQIRDGKTKVDVLIKESKGVISNALLVVNDDEDFVLISLEGSLSLKDLESLNLDVEGAEYFKKMKQKKGKKKA